MRASPIFIFTVLAWACACTTGFAAMLENAALRISVGEDTGVISMASTAAHVAGKVQIHLPGATGAGRPSAVISPSFGRGTAVILTGPAGPVGTLELFSALPFAVVRVDLGNPQKVPVEIDHVPVASLQIALGAPAEQLTTLGTGGLMPPARKPGSYAWMAVVDPASRHGVVVGWLTHARAGGTVFADTENGAVKIDARGEYGTLRLAPGVQTESESLAVGLFDDARLGLEAWADAVAVVDQIRLRPRPSGFCTWYAEQHGKAADEKSLADLVTVAARDLKPWGFSFVQIDDYWQLGNSKSGPNKNFTGHNPKGPYPSGMKATADMIKSAGLTPGIWFMPFAGNWDDPWFAAHQDWFVKRRDGTPFSSKWSATCLDMTQPGAREYVRSMVRRIAHDWGYTYFKMDGFHTGAGTSNIYVNSGYKADDMADAVFADPTKTNIEVFRSGIRLLREAAGPEVFFLGCCVTQNMRSYEGSFGLLDAMRVGPDNSGSWHGWVAASPAFGSRHYFLNGRIWWVDPDPVYVRKSVSLDEARTMTTWTALAGQLFANSDWIPALPPERMEILQRTMAPHSAVARPVDIFENPVPRIWLVTDGRGMERRDVAGFYNWSDANLELSVTPKELGLPSAEAYAVFDFWADAFLPVVTDRFKVSLAPHACQALAIRPALDHPFLLSTSAHVTQGMVDVTREKWNALARTLSGRSKVVAGEFYELRVFAPVPWQAATAEISDGSKVSLSTDGTGQRVSFVPSASGTVDWKISFR